MYGGGFGRTAMTTLLYTHPACLDHDPGPHHPESPARLAAVLAALAAPEFAGLDRREAPEAALDDLARVHPRRFVERLLAAVPSERPCRDRRRHGDVARARARRRCARPARSPPRSMR